MSDKNKSSGNSRQVGDYKRIGDLEDKLDSMSKENLHTDQCHKCNSVSGVYYEICDDCMTQFNKLGRFKDAAIKRAQDAEDEVDRLNVSLKMKSEVIGKLLEEIDNEKNT